MNGTEDSVGDVEMRLFGGCPGARSDHVFGLHCDWLLMRMTAHELSFREEVLNMKKIGDGVIGNAAQKRNPEIGKVRLRLIDRTG